MKYTKGVILQGLFLFVIALLKQIMLIYENGVNDAGGRPHTI
jgi:hypothetical protein